MLSLNKVLLVGRLAKDTKLRHTKKGVAYVFMDIAVNESYKDSSGEWKQTTDFVNCIAYRKTAEYIAKYVLKGEQVLIEGKISTRKDEKKDVIITEIQVESIKKTGKSKAREEVELQETEEDSVYNIEVDEDDLPF